MKFLVEVRSYVLKDVMLNMIYSCRAKMEGLKMARPKNKQELIGGCNTNYENLLLD